MNRKSETAVNDAIQRLAEAINRIEKMDVVNDAAFAIRKLQEALSASEGDRQKKKTPEGA